MRRDGWLLPGLTVLVLAVIALFATPLLLGG